MNRAERRQFEREHGRPPSDAEQLAHDGAQAQQPVAQIQPIPLPTTTTVGIAEFDGQKFVALQVQHLGGVSLFFLDPQYAKTVAGMLASNAAAATSGLTLPAGVDLGDVATDVEFGADDPEAEDPFPATDPETGSEPKLEVAE